MDLFELQEPPEVDEYLDEEMAKREQDFKNNPSNANEHHRVMAFYNSLKKDVAATRYHAAQVTDSATQLQHGSVMVSLARMAVYEKQLEEAIALYDKALQYDPEHITAMEEMNECLLKLERYEEVLKYAELAIQEEEEYFVPWHQKALALANLERNQEAIEAFKHTMELDDLQSAHASYHNCIGQCYAHMHNNYMALSHYHKALQIQPQNAEVLNNIGAVYCNDDEDLHDMQKAITYLLEAEALLQETDDDQIRKIIYQGLTQLYASVHEYENAKKYKDKLLAITGLEVFIINDSDDEWNAEDEEEEEDEEDDDDEEK